jgi:hypothetical protein
LPAAGAAYRQFLVTVTQTTAVLEPVYQAMVERVRSSDSIHTDDTPVPVLYASLPKRERRDSGFTAATGGIPTRFRITRRVVDVMAGWRF